MSDLSDETILALAPDASVQNMGDGAVILLAGSGQLYTCNETTEAFIKATDGTRTVAAIVALLCEEFDVGPDTAASDFRALAMELLAEGILEAA